MTVFEKCKQKLDQANKKLVELLLEKKNFWNPGPPLHSPNTVNYGYAPLDHHILQDTTWNEPYQPKYAHLIAGQGPQGAYSQARNERGTKYNPNYLEQNTDHNPNQDFGRVNDNGRTELLGTFKSGMSGLSHPRSKSFGTRMHVQQNVDLNSDPYYYEPQVQEETEWPQEIYIEPNEPKQALPLNPEHEFILEKDNYNHLSTEERIRELILNGDRMFNVK